MMRTLPISVALVSVCALGATTLVATASAEQQQRTTARPLAPASATIAQRPARPGAPAAPAASRRAPTTRGLLAISGFFQPGKASFTDTRDLPYFRETASQTGAYDIDGGAGIDVGVFARVWRSLGLGVSLSQVSRPGEAAFAGTYPHPFFFTQPRMADTTATGLDRSETGLHLSAAYVVTAPARLRFVLFAGPSFYSLSQDVIEEITINELYPFDTVAIAAGARSEVSESAVGFHGGADVSWYFSRRVGVGALVRYATATTSVSIGTGRSFDLEAGGFQAGLGLRVKF